MSELFSKIFRYIPKETNFKLFGFAHFLSIVGIAALVIIMCLIFRNKSKEVKEFYKEVYKNRLFYKNRPQEKIYKKSNN